jgi:hypothetical protein
MIVAHPSHNRSQQSRPHNGRLTGIDYTQDAIEAKIYVAMVARSAFGLDSGALATPSAPPPASEPEPYSPFVPINPPSSGPGRGGLQRINAPEAPAETPPAAAPQSARASSTGLIPAVETPVTPPVPEPVVLPPAPTIVPDPPAPEPLAPEPVVVVTQVVVVDTQARPSPPPPPAPVVAAQLAAAPTAVPEPGVWLMLVLGVGFVGAALRRRRRVVGA